MEGMKRFPKPAPQNSGSPLSSFLCQPGILGWNALHCETCITQAGHHRLVLVASLQDCSKETLAYAAQEEKVPQTTPGSIHPGLITLRFSRADCFANLNNPGGLQGRRRDPTTFALIYRGL